MRHDEHSRSSVHVALAGRTGRTPRHKELALMRQLLASPRLLTLGPVGQCSKKGWIRYDAVGGIYVLTDEGLRVLNLVDGLT